MAKKDSYRCIECGYLSSGWSGRCFSCKSWNSIIIDRDNDRIAKKESYPIDSVEYLSGEVEILEVLRLETGVSELDRLLGGGIVSGSVILVGGEPGIGKSTLMMHIVSGMSKYGKCLYISGEESSEQVKLRAKRLGISNSNVCLLFSTLMESILSTVKTIDTLKVIIVDSIQTLHSENCPSGPGTIAQVRFCAQELVNYAKRTGIPIIILGQITKDGQLAGPKMLEHMVDVVLYFEGDVRNGYLLLRGVKNRFGASNEVGIFEMRDAGLFSIENPSAMFTKKLSKHSHGSVVFASLEGSRPLLTEIQTLVSKALSVPTPRRAVVGWDLNRLAMIIAVLSSRCGIFLHDKEVYLNVAGGFRINDTAADLAVALSLMSSTLEIPVPESSVVFGEVALSGDVRSVSRAEARIRESCRMGFTRIVLPESCEYNVPGMSAVRIRHIKDLRGVFSL